ncbi:Trehalose transport system permease protein SugB [Hartmannibacter diazotrophicus]|uniref:Trehalose transport system permease protein SugB n=1 Tax=Hartmannibacter diazotrophicus TaxID=1482074 RepID=A0A2C9D9C0_9HYPH|nr:carbohydrate ABC transporter permease [Hartmannibacter diazotrophicus]SON56789.1 Trehalose transport system permease protein SugB [Hartmannibacter diazotrophicus]
MSTVTSSAGFGRWPLRIATGVLILWVLLPIYLLVVNTLDSPAEVTAWPKSFFPSFDLESLSFFAGYAGVAQALVNSVLVAVLTMLLSIGLGAPAGYALARFRFKGQGAFRLLVIMTRAFPLPLLALPLAVYYIRFGLDDSALGLALVHTTLALPFAVLITASLFEGIPLELEEAAWTLGCTRLQAFRKIVLPLAVPGIAASGVFAFVTSWNEVFAASVLTVRNQTLTAFLLTSIDVSPLPLKFAGAFVLVLPALIFLFLVRKYLFSLWGISNR